MQNRELEKKQRKIFIGIISLSVIFHFLGVFLISTNNDFATLSGNLTKKRPKRRAQRVRLVSKNKKQIVNTSRKTEKKIPKKDRFLGAQDQAFERETTAKKIGTQKLAGVGSKKARDKTNIEKSTASKGGKKKAQKKVKGFGKLRLDDLGPTKSVAQQMLRAEGTKNGDKNKVGAAENNDYLNDVPLGDFTQLNTREYKYYGFFQRIRKQLEQHWGNGLREKANALAMSGRRLASGIDRITSVRVVINGQGAILNVLVKDSSGVSELDQAAVDSFNKAGPFPNPPKGLLKNGEALIEWGFVVKS